MTGRSELDPIPDWARPLVGHLDTWEVDGDMIAIESPKVRNFASRVKVYRRNGDAVEVQQSRGWMYVMRARTGA